MTKKNPVGASEEKDASIRSLARGLELLNCFDEEHLTLSLTDFSNITGLSVSTISRILQTLVKMGYLNREVDRKYTLGHQVFRLMGILSNSSNLRATAPAHPPRISGISSTKPPACMWCGTICGSVWKAWRARRPSTGLSAWGRCCLCIGAL